ncbi:hypothetical protein PIB30_077678 [Stylosanthes scabra]|uniref:Putative plant transposon protein domain-containing protein n=1 Tax=Stylosanthes scabra TaxID=79078 RepID=A0ABU6ZP60_9FABA|nr:hypothetical protein [Stylosanthes scabra]
MRFKRETAGAKTDYKTRQAMDQRLDEVLADLCIQRATWKLSSGQPAVPIQLRRTELHPLAKGWQEFIIHSLVPTGNKSEVTIARAILIHCIMRGEEVRAEDIIANNMATIAQGLTNKGNLAFPSTIYKLCKDIGVPLREFRRTPRIPELSYITARRMEATRYPRNLPQPQQDDDDEDEPMPQADGGNDEEEDQQQPQQDQQPPQHGEISSGLHGRSQANKGKTRRDLDQQPKKREGRDIVEMRKQLNLWTRNTSTREAYTCWAHQQANPNLSEIPITQISDIMQTNKEKGRPMFYGCLKSNYGATSSSQVDPQ